MVLLAIRIIYLLIGIVFFVNLFEEKNIFFKIAYAFTALPFIMRALLLK